MILEAPHLRASYIDQALSDEDILAIEEFEHRWRSFLSTNPNWLPPGKKIKSCVAIQDQLEEMEVSKQMVQMELQRQLDFFANSKDQLEANFTKAMEEAALIQQDVSRKLNNEIDDIAEADQLLSKTLPWEHFLDNLDAATEEHNVADGNAAGSVSRGLKPSRQAMFLADNVDQGQVAEAAMEGKSSALLLRTFQIDNSLLKAQIKMMQQEVDRLERTTKSQKVLAQFLTEHNIWGLIKTSGSTVGAAAATVATPKAISTATATMTPRATAVGSIFTQPLAAPNATATAAATVRTPRATATAVGSAFTGQ